MVRHLADVLGDLNGKLDALRDHAALGAHVPTAELRGELEGTAIFAISTGRFNCP